MQDKPERGVVAAALPNALCTVLLRGDRFAQASLSGRLRARAVRCAEGDLVRIERSPYDRRRGRIVAREGHLDAATGIFREVPR